MQTEAKARKTVDLASHINQTIERGHPADFPITLRPLFYGCNGSFEHVAKRFAVVREDTGKAVAVVSDRYTLIPHQRILDAVEEAIRPLDVGPVPRGIYVDRQGARMRALYKFPALARPALDTDDICPCLKIQNTYDGTSRIAVHIGAFRFVCTNLAVGGGGAFAGGFMSIHAGDIPVEKVSEQLSSYLADFGGIVELYRSWAERPLGLGNLPALLELMPKKSAESIREEILMSSGGTVYDAYNVATRYATHQMRSYRTAFDLLDRINRGFQKQFPTALEAGPGEPPECAPISIEPPSAPAAQPGR
jgi:hypothetical protein